MKSFTTGARTVTIESRPGMVFLTVKRTDAKGRDSEIITGLPTTLANDVALAMRDAALSSGVLVAQDAALKAEQTIPVRNELAMPREGYPTPPTPPKAKRKPGKRPRVG